MILFEKFGQHQPLNRQSERYAREGIDLSVSTLADLVGAWQPRRWNRFMPSSKRMFWELNACTAMTPLCRSWRKAKRSPAASGPARLQAKWSDACLVAIR
jgi:hypothetical protein